ncbi:DNA-processing protein DprA [Candidatus Saccharibacteria bacterium]|nr:DNA-processing protein DprA [Candidatus Saccharibacteria bacterium]
MKIKQISPQENDYVKGLEDIALTPKMLYYYGEWPTRREKTVAIVGSRKCTKYGEDIAYRLGFELGKKGIMVISGLALGIDSIAARGAIDGGGKTIAILGTEIERIYPRGHIRLAEKIVEKGGVVASEYKLGDEVYPKTSFLMRNRIISGLSDVVVVVEAAERSGSLNTASHAIAQGKDLFAVPGDVGKMMSEGCNRLIQKGANVFLGVDDFLRYVLPPKINKKAREEQISLFGDTPEETEIMRLIAMGIRDGDLIMEKLEMGVEEFNQTITMLEIKGAVKPLGMNNWILA